MDKMQYNISVDILYLRSIKLNTSMAI